MRQNYTVSPATFFRVGTANGESVKQPKGKSDGKISYSRSKVKGSLKKGGKIKATGKYELHKGERVLNAKQAKKYGKKKTKR